MPEAVCLRPLFLYGLERLFEERENGRPESGILMRGAVPFRIDQQVANRQPACEGDQLVRRNITVPARMDEQHRRLASFIAGREPGGQIGGLYLPLRDSGAQQGDAGCISSSKSTQKNRAFLPIIVRGNFLSVPS